MLVFKQLFTFFKECYSIVFFSPKKWVTVWATFFAKISRFAVGIYGSKRFDVDVLDFQMRNFVICCWATVLATF